MTLPTLCVWVISYSSNSFFFCEKLHYSMMIFSSITIVNLRLKMETEDFLIKIFHIQKRNFMQTELWNDFPYMNYRHSPRLYLHYIFAILQFEISSLMNLIFSLFQTWILQATSGRRIQFKLGKISSSSNSIFQTGEL